MRRRRNVRRLSAAEKVAVYADAVAEVDRRLGRADPRRHVEVAALLDEHGVDAIECLIARRELRRRGWRS